MQEGTGEQKNTFAYVCPQVTGTRGLGLKWMCQMAYLDYEGKISCGQLGLMFSSKFSLAVLHPESTRAQTGGTRHLMISHLEGYNGLRGNQSSEDGQRQFMTNCAKE